MAPNGNKKMKLGNKKEKNSFFLNYWFPNKRNQMKERSVEEPRKKKKMVREPSHVILS